MDPPNDAAPSPLPDAPKPDPKPLTACDAGVAHFDLGVGDAQVMRGDFYASAFYFATADGFQRKRLGGTTQMLLPEGQAYPRLGATAKLHLNPFRFEFRAPGGDLVCDPSVQIPLSLGYQTGTATGDVVVLLDDLTFALTHVLATGDPYDGDVVTKVEIASSYGACGRMVLRVALAGGRTLLVLRDPQSSQLKTLMSIADLNETRAGQPIDGAPDRFLGVWNFGSLERSEFTFMLSVDNGTAQRQGWFLGSLDLSSNKITCRVTDTDIPCATQRPNSGSRGPTGWSQGGDTAVSNDSVLTIVRGDRVVQQIDSGSGVVVCKDTGDVFFLRSFQPAGFTSFVQEVFAVRRAGKIERVTRNFELGLAGGTSSSHFSGLALTSKCDVLQGTDDKRAIYWRDGVLGIAPIDFRYFNVGYDGNTVVPMINFSGNSLGGADDHARLISQPSGNCQVPSDVFPALTK